MQPISFSNRRFDAGDWRGPQAQAILLEAHQQSLLGCCLCNTPPPVMQARLRGNRYEVVTFRGDATAHAETCPSYPGSAQRNATQDLLHFAGVLEEQGGFDIRLAAPMELDFRPEAPITPTALHGRSIAARRSIPLSRFLRFGLHASGIDRSVTVGGSAARGQHFVDFLAKTSINGRVAGEFVIVPRRDHDEQVVEQVRSLYEQWRSGSKPTRLLVGAVNHWRSAGHEVAIRLQNLETDILVRQSHLTHLLAHSASINARRVFARRRDVNHGIELSDEALLFAGVVVPKNTCDLELIAGAFLVATIRCCPVESDPELCCALALEGAGLDYHKPLFSLLETGSRVPDFVTTMPCLFMEVAGRLNDPAYVLGLIDKLHFYASHGLPLWLWCAGKEAMPPFERQSLADALARLEKYSARGRFID